MATDIIVAKDKHPLDPGEVAAGDEIAVSERDAPITEASTDDDFEFVSVDGTPDEGDIHF